MKHHHEPLGPHTLPTGSDGHSLAARTWRPLVEQGMLVAGVAGDVIGEVVEVADGSFVVDRPGGLGLEPGDMLALPYERIHVMHADRLTLDVSSSRVQEHAVATWEYAL
jgi:hypothetical protein